MYIGMISGTSVDGIDAALVDFSGLTPKLMAHHSEAIPNDLKTAALTFHTSGENELDRLGSADVQLGKLFAQAAHNLLKKANIKSSEIVAIGSHGQNIRHRPTGEFPFTLQIGDPNIIAELTNITTVADFRRRDIAAGGQGAPFAPLFHNEVLRSNTNNRAIVNIGGISNVSLLALDNSVVLGFDTGPGNGLLDAWIKKHKNKNYDQEGAWAVTGIVDTELLENLLADPYFKKAAPKSTGREYFNLTWLNNYLSTQDPTDVQATLVELTAQTIIDAVKKQGFENGELVICGGGTHNQYLMQRLATLAPEFSVLKTDDLGIPADWIEAMLFAWLAKQTMEHIKVDTRSITGAKNPVILGGIYLKN
ncbi:MAG: anhydro-N-acetylmuramic acid kinase [Gammaproteobacteria bacterium]|nr:anhydro-N-acetylmuramic acid kinase [Gammaproteobacteria bacterium]